METMVVMKTRAEKGRIDMNTNLALIKVDTMDDSDFDLQKHIHFE